jgi:hypothetical protein
LNDDEKSLKDLTTLYTIVNDEYKNSFTFLNLYKKDYFSIIGTIITIFAVFGYLINTSNSIYLIPISFSLILFFSGIVIIIFFYKFYYIERLKMPDNDLSDVLCIDLFYKNIRPIFYAISLLLLINMAGVIIVISGVSGVQNIQEIFFNFIPHNMTYDQTLISLSSDQKITFDGIIQTIEQMYVLSIGLQLLVILAFTFIIYKMRPPYPGSNHIAKIVRYAVSEIKEKKSFHKQILSSLYYLVLKYTDNFVGLVYLVPLGLGCCYIVWSLSFTLGQPVLTQNSTIILEGLLIGLIQLIAFVLLLDYFENSQINTFYFERLQKMQDTKITIENHQINGTTEDIDCKKIMATINLLNSYTVKRIQLIFVFTLPTLSLNPLAINVADKQELRNKVNFKQEAIMNLTNKGTLFIKCLTLFIFTIPLLLMFFSPNNQIDFENFVSSIGFLISGFIMILLMKLCLPHAFEAE